MSLSSILKEIDKVDQKQKIIYQRYNNKNKKNLKHSELIEEEQEDKKIYGYSHSDLLRQFRKSQNSTMKATRPCTAFQSKPMFSCDTEPSHKNIEVIRTKSTNKTDSNYKKQFNFLFKEDIFDQNHQKLLRKNQKQYSEHFLANKKINQKFHKITQKIPEKFHTISNKNLKKDRINFIKNFDQNGYKYLISMNKMNALKKQKNKIEYQRRLQTNTQFVKQSQKQNLNDDLDFFNLTKINAKAVNEKLSKGRSLMGISENKIKSLNKFLKSKIQMKYLNCKREDQYRKSLPLFESNIKYLLPNKFTLTIIAIENLHILQIKLIKANGIIVNEETQQIINLSALLLELLSQNSFIHVYLHEGQFFFYEQFLINKSLSYTITKQNEIKFMHYYLKRFLLLDPEITVSSVIENSDLLIKCNMDIPDQFIDFIENFKNKSCSIFDKDKRLYVLNLKNILENGLNSILQFKKQMGFGQKVVKLKHGTKEQCKKFLYNWEYFYICFFLLTIKFEIVVFCHIQLCFVVFLLFFYCILLYFAVFVVFYCIFVCIVLDFEVFCFQFLYFAVFLVVFCDIYCILSFFVVFCCILLYFAISFEQF